MTETKATNPKDGIGARKWRKTWFIPTRVMWEVGIAFLEGALKYGGFNYRIAGVRASVYIEAAIGHIEQFKEGEDTDPESGLSHIVKAIASLVVLRDGMLAGNWVDDRPPAHADLDVHRRELQATVDRLFDQYPDPAAPYTEIGRQ